jgi:hypothetical protein
LLRAARREVMRCAMLICTAIMCLAWAAAAWQYEGHGWTGFLCILGCWLASVFAMHAGHEAGRLLRLHEIEDAWERGQQERRL